MMFNPVLLVLAAGAGALGTLIGGMEAFILYGFVLIVQTVLASAGHDMTFYNTYLANLMFVPCIMFNGAVPATAFASKRYDIRAWDTDRSLAFTHDPAVLLVGALTGAFGYLGLTYLSAKNFPGDAGACMVVTVGVISRLIWHNRRWYNRDAVRVLSDPKRWVWNLSLAALGAAVTAFFAVKTGINTVGFMMSAALLILQLFPRTDTFPTTHQITMAAGYAAVFTGNIWIGVLFGVLAQVIFMVFGGFFNMGNGALIDPPAVAILTCSLLVNLLF